MRALRENSLSIAVFSLFLITVFGQSVFGLRQYNEDQEEHGQASVGYGEYVRSGNFVSTVFENWESEFLQMAMYVLLTVFLRQKGSPESKKLEGEEKVDQDPRRSRREDAPWPVKKRGWILKLYENSLSLAMLLLFLLCLALHAWGSLEQYNEEQAEHGSPAISLAEHLGNPRFWFESFQNWQSEFLAIGALLVLSIFLRQRGSPESKPVDHPHGETGLE